MNRYQVGVFPVTEDGKVVLVTRRASRAWIFPKGKPETGRSDRAVARDEAYEEAGLYGVMALGYQEFRTPSLNAPNLRLFRMRVTEILERYPEIKQRKRIIVSFAEAEKLLSKELRKILRQMRR